MANFRKIKAGLVKSEIEDFVGEEGNLFFNIETGELRLSDGVTPGGTSVGGGGGGGTYTLPTASTTVKGGVKVDGTTIQITNQVISGFSGSYADLTSKPSLFSGSYTDLTNKPALFSGSYTDLTNKPTLFSGSYTDLTNKPVIPTVPTNVSAFTNDAGYLTTVGTISYNNLTDKPTIPTVPTNVSAFTNDSGYLTTVGTISYNNLTDKPTIPSMTVSLIDSENTVSSPLTDITAIRFDTDSGFDITDLGSGAVKVGMNSTFKFWKVDGQSDLVANGLDTIELVAGSGLAITTNPLSDPKSITFRAVDKTVTLYQDGVLEPTTGTIRWYNPSAVNVNKITARLATAADDVVTVLIKKNGVTAQTVTFPANNTKQVAVSDIDMAIDDYLTVDITTVGNVNRGRGLSVEFTYSFE